MAEPKSAALPLGYTPGNLLTHKRGKRESNPRQQVWSLLCYHYTIPPRGGDGEGGNRTPTSKFEA